MRGAKFTDIWKYLRYFLWLGTFGFGGPIVLLGLMKKDLVEKRGWFSKDDYLHGFALSQVFPGPAATKLAMFLGWVASGPLGALGVGVAFTLPSFIMVLLIAEAYMKWGTLPSLEGLFYGMGASVIALIARSSLDIAKMTLGKDILYWVIFLANVALVLILKISIVWGLISEGLLAMFLKAPPQFFPRIIHPSSKMRA